MYQVKKIDCSTADCTETIDVVLSPIQVIVVAKPSVVEATISSIAREDIVLTDNKNVKDFDDYIVVFCDKKHKNKVFLKKELK